MNAQDTGDERRSAAATEAGGVAIIDDQASRLRALVLALGGDLGAARPAPDRPGDGEPARAPRLVPGTRAKVITISSGKGGVGKTNTAVNLCIALTRMGARVTLMDADLGTANADVVCGLMPSARLEHVIHPAPSFDGGYRRLHDILIDAPGGFRLAPGTAGVARMADLGLEQRGQLLAELEQLGSDADVLVIDAAAGVGSTVTSLMDAADLAIVVTTPEPTAIADAYAVIKCDLTRRREAGARVNGASQNLSLLVNQAADGLEARSVHARIASVCAKFLGLELSFEGWIEQDMHVSESVRAKKPYMLHSPDCHASRDIQRVAGSITQRLGLRGLHAPKENGLAVKGGRLSRLFRRGVAE